MIDHQLGHDNGAERHDHAARQIDAGGQDNERLTNGDDADHHDLLQDKRKILATQEAVALGGKKSTSQKQGKERPERRNRRQAFEPATDPGL